MTTRTAYVWGPASNFYSQLVFWLLRNGWTVHVPTKSAMHVSLSPLDLRSTVIASLDRALGAEGKVLGDRLIMLDSHEIPRGANYDVIIFCGLPANFDEPRLSRAPWAADDLKTITGRLKGTPVVVVSSLWSGVQEDGVVPEEVEFERRKPLTHYEAVCQQYELKVLKVLETSESLWHVVRLPLISGNIADGSATGFSGLSTLVEVLSGEPEGHSAELSFNPDATIWMLPADVAAELVGKLTEDQNRPRILNLVSTQSRLNQEWLQDLARACGLVRVVHVEKDNLPLPGTLRAILEDDMQVRTRNLFEVLGRHNQSPIVLDEGYFQRWSDYGRLANWGRSRKKSGPEYSLSRADEYFFAFLPSHTQGKHLKALSALKGGILFSIDKTESSWLLTTVEGQPVVRIFDPQGDKPAARINITREGFEKLVNQKVAFEMALLTRVVTSTGNPIESLKALDFFKNFIRTNCFEKNPQAEKTQKEPVKEHANRK